MIYQLITFGYCWAVSLLQFTGSNTKKIVLGLQIRIRIHHIIYGIH
jgi:hypothetical protein